MKTIRIFILMLLFFTSSFSNEKTIKIAVNSTFVPYSFYNDDNEIDGIFIEYWKLWAKKNNKKIEFVVYEWSEALKALNEGKVDIHSGLYKSKKREKYIDFVNPFFISTAFLYKNNSKEKQNFDKKRFLNKKVGVIKGSYYEEFLKTNYPEVSLHIFYKLNDLIDSIQNDQIDYVLNDAVFTWFRLLNNLRYKNVKKVNNFKLQNWFYAGVKKGNKKLFEELKQSMKKVSKKEIMKIEERWIPTNELSFLREYYTLFTKEELDYLQKKKKIKVGISEWKPIHFINSENKIDGLIGEYFRKFLQTIDIEFEFVKGDWNSLVKDFNSGKLDILPSMAITEDRKKYGNFSQDYFSLRSSIFIKEENSDEISSFNDLRNKKLALIKNDIRVLKVKEKFPDINIVEVISVKDAVVKLLSGEVDALFDTNLVIENYINEYLVTNLISVEQSEIDSIAMHFYSKKEEKVLNSILNKLLDSIPQNEKELMTNKWISINNDDNLSVVFEVGRVPYSKSNEFIRGIEEELINKIFEKSKYKIKIRKYVRYIKEDELNSDVLVNVKKKEKNRYFYSNDFISFENVIIARKDENLKVRDLSQLDIYKIGAFKKAYKSLGPKFYDLYKKAKENDNYKEYVFQEKQVVDFISGELDLLLIDKKIFKWYLKNLSNINPDEFEVIYTFKNKNIFQVAFKNKNVRDFFNIKLGYIKKSGEYFYF